MTPLRIALARVRALFRRNSTLDEIREELQFHVDMRAEALRREGVDPEEARRAALGRFGNLAVIQDRGYDVRGGGLLETIVQDLRYGLRQLRRDPTFSLIAVLTLAVGTGVSTALFSVVDAALLRPLPYPNPEQLVTLSVEGITQRGTPARLAPSMADIRSWRTLTTVVSHAGMGRVSGFVPLIVETHAPQRLTVAEASEGFLDTYGIFPMLGRGIDLTDTLPGAPPVALVGHTFWQQEFGADPNVLGRVLRIQNEPVTIVGVLPAGFYSDTAVWQAKRFAGAQLESRGSGTPVIARLRPGVTAAQATAALEGVTAPFGPGPANTPTRVVIESMYDDETGQAGATIRTLALAVGLILLIACVNVAGLLLARGATRDLELAIRASIGAGRWRLVRQLLTESLLLALAGAVAGVLLAYASLDSLVALIPLSLPPNSPVAINVTALTFALLLTFVTALLFGLGPALTLSRTPRSMAAAFSGGRARAPLSRRAGQLLIAIEVSLAAVLLSGSGLILRSFANLLSVDLGFDAGQVMTLDVEPLDRTGPVRQQYYAALTAALRQLPEVAAAGAIDRLALSGGATVGFTTADNGSKVSGPQRTVVPGFFEALSVRPLAGRLFAETDLPAADAIVVNASLMERHFAGNAVGHTLRSTGKVPRQWQIVGVVPDLRHGGPQGRVQPEMYVLPDRAAGSGASTTLAMVFRLRDGARLPFERLKQIAESQGPRVLVGPARPAAAIVREQVARPRHRTILLAMLGGFGLLLTLVGIFSVTAYAVVRRTREIGVRVACGARSAQVVGLMVRDTAWPVALGLVAGLAGTYYASRVITSFLFQTSPYDPPTLLAVVTLLATAGCLAAWVPARRAAAVDPASALRAE